MDEDTDLKQVNTDIVFFFILVVCSIVSFSLIIERKKTIYHTSRLTEQEQYYIYKVNRFIIMIVAIYFVINAYTSLQEMKEKKEDERQIKKQENILLATIAFFVSANLYFTYGGARTLIYY